MVNWKPYLDSLCNTYTQWWKFGTLKDVVEPKRVESEQSTLPFDFGLMVQTVERDTQQRGKEKQKVEPLSVLEGLQKYAPNHVLLVGRPGSGKSTALVRLLLATAQQALQNPHIQIPVLVELRTYKVYYKTSVLDLVQASLKRRRLRLNLETLEDELAEGRFLLLMDGINELPDDEDRRAIKEFRLDYSDVPMVFTTRDLGVGGDLGIERKLELQSLTEAEVEKFVRECMPGGSQQTLQQLRQRLRELGQTPFVMWMLYFIVQKTGTVPSGAGSAFREFTQLYERRSKDDAPVSDESRRWWSRLLEHLGFEMMQADKPTDFRLTISRREAEDILTKVLDSEKFDKPRDRAIERLEDLLKHHLIQVTRNDQIEFCHQLIQEYYAAEILLEVLTPPTPLVKGGARDSDYSSPLSKGGLRGVSDDELKREYLNYLKWTEPLALMLELVEDEAQAVRVVKLALEVDLRLGARLAGAVKPEWQEQTVGLVSGLNLPLLLKLQLLGLTKSEKAIPELVNGLNHEDLDVRESAANALGNIGSEAAIPELVKALNDEDFHVRSSAANALGKIGSEAAIRALGEALKDENSDVRWSAVSTLGDIGSETAILELVKALEHENSDVRLNAATELLGIDNTVAVNASNMYFENREIDSSLSDEEDIHLEATHQEINQAQLDVFWDFAHTAEIEGDDAAVDSLIKALQSQDLYIRYAALAKLGTINNEKAVNAIIIALQDEISSIRIQAVYALSKNSSDAAVPQLITALNDEVSEVRSSAAYALGKIASSELLPSLFEHLKTEKETNLLDTIAAIQNRCKFYNYKIAISPPPQEEKYSESLTEDLQQYEDILSVIHHITLTMERSPKTFQDMKEENLRDFFLAYLNGQSKGQATGETFNGNGKTDILIRMAGKNIFIAECKFWGGEKKLKETLDQLLGYTTWRDTKLAMLIFNRNKNFSAVLEQISQVMKNHPTFTQELSYPSETGFRFILHHPDDKNRELLLTVLAFEIPRSH